MIIMNSNNSVTNNWYQFLRLSLLKVKVSEHGGSNTMLIKEKSMTIIGLKDQIWTTRISRVNAEKRLVNKDKFFQGINIYYSCMTIIFSIMSLSNDDKNLSLLTIFITISLLISILYVNSQNYIELAKDYRNNYTNLQRLEFRLEHIEDANDSKIIEIEEEYCNLLHASSNHIAFDYYCTIYGSSGDYRKKRWSKNIKIKFYWGKTWRSMIGFLLIVLPWILYMICEVF